MRTYHISELDVTSALKGKREKALQRRLPTKNPDAKVLILLDLFRSGFFLEEYIKNSVDHVDQSEQSCSGPSAFTLVLASIYHRCSGSARFTCFDQATIPGVWIDERIFGLGCNQNKTSRGHLSKKKRAL